MCKWLLGVSLLAASCGGGGAVAADAAPPANAPSAGNPAPAGGMHVLSLSSFNGGWGMGRCAYGATTFGSCDAAIACDPLPMPGEGAGDVTISDGSQQVVYVMKNGGYVSDDVSPQWVRNDLTISAPGADIPGFSLTTPEPVTLTVSAPAARSMHPVDEPLEVTWTGGPADYQNLVFGTHDGSGGRKTKSCLLEGGTQSHTLTPEDLSFIGPVDDDVQICVQGIAASSATSGDWLFEASRMTSGICVNVTLVAPTR